MCLALGLFWLKDVVCQDVFSTGLGIREWALSHETAWGPFPPSPYALNGFVAVVVPFLMWPCLIRKIFKSQGLPLGPVSELMPQPHGLETGKSPREGMVFTWAKKLSKLGCQIPTSHGNWIKGRLIYSKDQRISRNHEDSSAGLNQN